MALTEHIIDCIINPYGFAQPYPAIHFQIRDFHFLRCPDQILSEPAYRYIPIIRMNMNAVLPLLHLFAPLVDRCIRILWRIIQIDHLEPTAVPADKRCFDVGQLVLAFPIIKKFRQLVQDDQLDRLILVNDPLRIVNPIGTSKVNRSAIFFICNLHRRFCDPELAFRYFQPIDPAEDLLIHGLPELVVVLSEYNHRTMPVRYNLVICPDRRITGLGTGTPGSQDDMLIGLVVEYPLVLRDNDLRYSDLLFLPLRHL